MSIRDRLVADWRRAHKWASIRLSALGVFLFSALAGLPELVPHIWAQVPVDVKEYLPAGLKSLLPLLFVVAIIIGRIHKRKDKADG